MVVMDPQRALKATPPNVLSLGGKLCQSAAAKTYSAPMESPLANTGAGRLFTFTVLAVFGRSNCIWGVLPSKIVLVPGAFSFAPTHALLFIQKKTQNHSPSGWTSVHDEVIEYNAAVKI